MPKSWAGGEQPGCSALREPGQGRLRGAWESEMGTVPLCPTDPFRNDAGGQLPVQLRDVLPPHTPSWKPGALLRCLLEKK